MSGSAETSEKALHASLLLLKQFESQVPLPDIMISALESMVSLSGSRFAFLLHNHSGTLISEFTAHHPGNTKDEEHLKKHAAEMYSCLLPQIRRTAPLIANSSTAVKAELANTLAWRLFQRLMLIPLTNSMGDKKGILVLFGRQNNYGIDDINGLESLISLCVNLLILDELRPEEESQLTKRSKTDLRTEAIRGQDFQFINSKTPRFITTAEGIIINHNSSAGSLLAFPSERLTGQAITQLIPKLKLNLHQKDPDELQELKAHSKAGNLINVRVSCLPFIKHSELLFSIQIQDVRAELETNTERHEKSIRIRKQQRATLEVARIATQEDAPFEQLVREICQLASNTLQAPRAGIWLAEEDTPVYRNVVQIDHAQANYCEKSPLLLNSNTTFVRQLEQVRVLSLSNLNRSDSGSGFLSQEYIQRNQTATLICAAFIKNSNLIGFLMIEDTQRTQWHEDQYSFVREVANYLHILVLNEHRRNIQSDLIQQEQQFRLLFFDSPLSLMAFDRETFQFIAVNHTATEVFGYSLNEMLSKGIYDLIPVQQVMDIHALVSINNENGNYHVLESRMQKHSGDVVDVEIHSHSINLSSRPSILMVVHDITEKKRIESSLRRTQKMEAIGQLVGGIAHDFNNITNIIRGHAELLEMKIGDDEKTNKHLCAINKAATRTTSLTHKLMQFSRQQQINSEVCHIDDILSDLIELITKSLTRNIQIVLEISKDLWPVLIDRGDFEDVMINLAINARDAMDGQGTLTIGATNVSLDTDDSLIVRDRQPGDYICISVQDTGSGIPKELQEKIFDPFFTTKEKGKGTGLGLSMVYGFAKRSSGFLEVESHENIGTTFCLWLPRSETVSTLRHSSATLIPEVEIPAGHTALVVDDEEDIRSSLHEILETIGFKTQQAGSADEAKEIIKNEPQNFSLVLSDIVMPGSENGVQLAQWIKTKTPETRVILASGYAENISLAEARKFSCELLKKPFGKQDILNILNHWQWDKK
ncbi:PAS domain S-box protein [Oceanospirillum sp.]|uniref:PAS domain S-box protein n=1 Tax=Oceanospirillum sp. TaxID=2021254 RepID=UPI003A8EF79F